MHVARECSRKRRAENKNNVLTLLYSQSAPGDGSVIGYEAESGKVVAYHTHDEPARNTFSKVGTMFSEQGILKKNEEKMETEYKKKVLKNSTNIVPFLVRTNVMFSSVRDDTGGGLSVRNGKRYGGIRQVYGTAFFNTGFVRWVQCGAVPRIVLVSVLGGKNGTVSSAYVQYAPFCSFYTFFSRTPYQVRRGMKSHFWVPLKTENTTERKTVRYGPPSLRYITKHGTGPLSRTE